MVARALQSLPLIFAGNFDIYIRHCTAIGRLLAPDMPSEVFRGDQVEGMEHRGCVPSGAVEMAANLIETAIPDYTIFLVRG